MNLFDSPSHLDDDSFSFGVMPFVFACGLTGWGTMG